ncbi:MAG: AMP-binding protein [Gaiellaceae bacterium]
MARAQGAVEQLIRARAAAHPDATWLKWQDEEVAWRDVVSYSQRAANGLLELGVRPGERVALLMSNRPEFLWAHFGILLIGAHSVPVNISQRGATLHHILADSGVSAIVFQEDLRDWILAVRSDLPALRHTVVQGGPAGPGVDWDFERLMSGADREPEIELAEPSGGVGMMYTSGTTGPPKGVVTTNYDLTPISRLLDASGVQAGETMYTGLPLFHGNALYVSMLGSIILDAKLALAPKFTASRFFHDCARYQAVEFNTLGGMISILLKQPPKPTDRDHQVRVVLSAGCPPDRWEEFEKRFGVRVIEWFGMVDSPGILLNDVGKVGSMGRSGVAGVEFRVVDDDEVPLGPQQVGELVFRHPKGPMTYYNNLPDATESAYRGGWFHSGDLAEYDADGFFYYRGRKKESMRRLGENISAWEVETVVNAHPKVLDCAAHPVRSELGEDEVKICVVPQPGQSPGPEELVDFCVGRMAHYAVPRYVEFLDALPKTETQRNQYAALRARGVTPRTWDREQAGYQVRRG